MAEREVLSLDESTPQILAPQAGDTYVMPRDVRVAGVVAAGAGTLTTDKKLLDLSATWNAPAITTTGASGDGTTATITFAAQPAAFPIGSTIVVATIQPTGYRGTFVVTGSTTTSVSFLNATTAAQTVAGTVQQRMNGIVANFTDTASQTNSNLMDLRVGGSSRISVTKVGAVTFSGALTIGGIFTMPNNSAFNVSGTNVLSITNASEIQIRDAAYLGWGVSIASSGNSDLRILRDAADTLAQRRGTNAQTFRLYNTFTDASNYERGFLRWDSNVFQIGAENAGTGVFRDVTVRTSNRGSAGTAGTLSLVAGSGTVAGAKGGSVAITAGSGGSGNFGGGGNITITAGASPGDNVNPPGNVTISGGASGGSLQGGSVTINGGAGAGNSTSGNVSILSGNQNIGNNVTFNPTGTVTVASSSGPLSAGGGATQSAASSGATNIQTGSGGTVNSGSTQAVITCGSSGAATLSTGNGGSATAVGTTRNAGSSGNVTIATGAGGSASGGTTNNGGNSGTIAIRTGASGTGSTVNGTPGDIVLSTNNTTRLTINGAGGFTVADAQNIAVDTTTGTKIGTGTTQKLAFWNATPVAQPTAVADATDAATVITQLNALLAHMRTLGLIAT